MTVIRPATAADAEAVVAIRIANRKYFEPWELSSDDPERWYTVKGVRAWLTDGRERFVILDSGEVAGLVSITGVERDAFQSAMVSYFVDAAHTRRGLATAAVEAAAGFAFGELGLHRLEAGTATANVASQRVLEKSHFTKVGLLRHHLRIGGEWVDHFLWERLETD
ncbi:MAG TPA: GNAT family protein [Gaiellaceae bacterium]|nr:GNAT family protein [Gaiellaceae bacterium]